MARSAFVMYLESVLVDKKKSVDLVFLAAPGQGPRFDTASGRFDHGSICLEIVCQIRHDFWQVAEQDTSPPNRRSRQAEKSSSGAELEYSRPRRVAAIGAEKMRQRLLSDGVEHLREGVRRPPCLEAQAVTGQGRLSHDEIKGRIRLGLERPAPDNLANGGASTSFREALASLGPNGLSLLFVIDPGEFALEDGGQVGGDLPAVVHCGVLLLEDFRTRELEVPHGEVDAEALQGFEEVGGGGLLPHLRQIKRRNGHG